MKEELENIIATLSDCDLTPEQIKKIVDDFTKLIKERDSLNGGTLSEIYHLATIFDLNSNNNIFCGSIFEKGKLTSRLVPSLIKAHKSDSNKYNITDSILEIEAFLREIVFINLYILKKEASNEYFVEYIERLVLDNVQQIFNEAKEKRKETTEGLATSFTAPSNKIYHYCKEGETYDGFSIELSDDELLKAEEMLDVVNRMADVDMSLLSDKDLNELETNTASLSSI